VRLILPFAALLPVACSHLSQQAPGRPGPAVSEQPITFLIPSFTDREGNQIKGPSLQEADRHNADLFRRQNAAWLVPDDGPMDIAPVAVRDKFSHRQTVVKLGRLRLDLSLGEEYGLNSRTRTHSRYKLKSQTGATLAQAESILPAVMDEGLSPRVEVYADADYSSVLVIESRDGSETSCLLFTAGPGTNKWSARRVEIPIRETPSPSPMDFSRPSVVCVRDGKIYIDADGALYAIPFEALKEVPPGFIIG